MKIYLVGGAVRDELMGRPVTDFDYVVVGATHAELEAKFGPSVGMDFPVFLDKETGAQYAMARRERKVGVGYHGFAVDADETITLEEDLSRRDLTINAIAKDMETGLLIDPFNGLKDLDQGVLRHVSEAFAEDPLRVVRLARFYARYQFEIADETIRLAKDVVDSGEMDSLPFERYWVEVEKAMDDGNIVDFFNFIEVVGGFQKIKFFRDIWGDKGVDVLLLKMERIQSQQPTYMQFVALTALHDLSQIHAAPAKVVEWQKVLKHVHDFKRLTVDEVFHLLKVTKAFSQSPLASEVVELMRILIGARYIMGIFPDELHDFVLATRKITSEPFQHLKGAEIGKAMEEARKEAIANLIKEM